RRRGHGGDRALGRVHRGARVPPRGAGRARARAERDLADDLRGPARRRTRPAVERDPAPSDRADARRDAGARRLARRGPRLGARALATSITAPALAEADGPAARLVGRTAVKGFLLTLALAVPVAVAAPFAIPLVLGDEYRKAALALALLLPGVVVYAPVSIL